MTGVFTKFKKKKSVTGIRHNTKNISNVEPATVLFHVNLLASITVIREEKCPFFKGKTDSQVKPLGFLISAP